MSIGKIHKHLPQMQILDELIRRQIVQENKVGNTDFSLCRHGLHFLNTVTVKLFTILSK